MHRMPGECVMLGIFRVRLHGGSDNGSQIDQHGEWEDENQ